jgi:hypothetical protein
LRATTQVARENATPAIVNLQEAAVPQVFSLLAHSTIDTLPTSRGLSMPAESALRGL